MPRKDLENQLEGLFSDASVPRADVGETLVRETFDVGRPDAESPDLASAKPEVKGQPEEIEAAPKSEERLVGRTLPLVGRVSVEGEAPRKSLRFHLRWSIASKLTVASTLMILLVILAGGTGLWQVWRIGHAMSEAFVRAEQRSWVDNLSTAGYRLVAALDHLLLEKEDVITSKEVQPALGYLKFYLEALEGSGKEVGFSTLLVETRLAYEELRRAVNEVDLLARQERWPEMAAVLEQQVRPANDAMRLVTRRLAQRANQDATEAARLGRFVAQQAVALVMALVVLSTAIAVVWRQAVFHVLGRSIADLREGVARISSGDLDHVLHIQTGDEVEELATEFNAMAAQLADLIATLEQRVADRTRELDQHATQLQTAAEVSRAASSLLEAEELIHQTVNLIRNGFDYYYVGLFLLGASADWAMLRAGTGHAGHEMLAQGHKLKVGGDSMIGWCTAHGQARIALDVGEEAIRFDNPLLPETRSEMALPLISRGRIIGALTVQSVKPQAFSDEDVAVLQTMADQVANAVENARLLREMERLARRNELVSEISGKLRGALGLEGVLQTTVRELGLALGASEAVIRLGALAPSAQSGGDGHGEGEGKILSPRRPEPAEGPHPEPAEGSKEVLS
jgi:GAF domain-containing protein